MTRIPALAKKVDHFLLLLPLWAAPTEKNGGGAYPRSMGLLPQEDFPQKDGQEDGESSQCGPLVAEALGESKDSISSARLLPRMLHVCDIRALSAPFGRASRRG